MARGDGRDGELQDPPGGSNDLCNWTAITDFTVATVPSHTVSSATDILPWAYVRLRYAITSARQRPRPHPAPASRPSRRGSAMRVSITEHRLRYGHGPIQARLYAGLRGTSLTSTSWNCAGAARVTDPETRFITLRFEDALRAEVLGLLRTWPRVHHRHRER
ncbi:MAG: hypothetical protein R3F43_15895 [bacterium]